MKLKFTISILFVILLLSCNPEGGLKNPRNYYLFTNISADQNPSVSPDGKLVAYYHKCFSCSEPGSYPTGLYVMNIDGTNRRLLLEGAHWSPSWSPDGNLLVFTSNGVLQIINLTGDSIRTFEGVNDVPLYFPDWSPDGKLILFSSPYVEGGGFFLCNPFFQNVRLLFSHYDLPGINPTWSPEGEKILYTKYVNKNEELFVVDTSGNFDTQLTNIKGTNRYPAWSPDGKMIAWSSNTEIYLMNADGSNQHRLDYGRFPTWSNDSKYIIYSNANDDFSEEVLYIIDINGKNKIQLTY